MENDQEIDNLDFEIEEAVAEQEDENITLTKSDFKKLDRKARAYDAAKQTVKPIEKRPQKDTLLSDDKYDRLDLKISGHSDEAINFLMKNGGKESLSNPYVKSAIDAINDQKKAEQAVTSNETTKSDVERKFSQDEIAAMSPEELYKILPKARK